MTVDIFNSRLIYDKHVLSATTVSDVAVVEQEQSKSGRKKVVIETKVVEIAEPAVDNADGDGESESESDDVTDDNEDIKGLKNLFVCLLFFGGCC